MKTQPFIHAKASRARGRRRLWSSALTTSVGALTVTSSCKQAGFVCDTACFFWVYNVHPRKALPPSRAIRLIMLSFSTSTLISALALCSALTGLVHATGPRTRCIGAPSFPRSVDVPACLLGRPTPYREVSHPVGLGRVTQPTLPFADLTAPRTQAKQRQLCSARGAGQREHIYDRVHEPRSKLYVSPFRMCRTAH